ncbi:MAG: prepilin-type N-terminal cleavage/methylation domain-containing protein [Brachymonas sp.]|nr:prepilin-type N-terminal cleavage/methylation domain-containing protein [Brachymonas sp.]
MTSLRRRIKQTGVTLIELLVAMTLGALVIGTVVALYTNTSSARAQSQAFG